MDFSLWFTFSTFSPAREVAAETKKQYQTLKKKEKGNSSSRKSHTYHNLDHDEQKPSKHDSFQECDVRTDARVSDAFIESGTHVFSFQAHPKKSACSNAILDFQPLSAFTKRQSLVALGKCFFHFWIAYTTPTLMLIISMKVFSIHWHNRTLESILLASPVLGLAISLGSLAHSYGFSFSCWRPRNDSGQTREEMVKVRMQNKESFL